MDLILTSWNEGESKGGQFRSRLSLVLHFEVSLPGRCSLRRLRRQSLGSSLFRRLEAGRLLRQVDEREELEEEVDKLPDRPSSQRRRRSAVD